MKPLTEKIAMIIANRLEVGGWDKCDENKRNLYRHIAQAALKEIKFEQLVGALREANALLLAGIEQKLSGAQVNEYGQKLEYLRPVLSELEKPE